MHAFEISFFILHIFHECVPYKIIQHIHAKIMARERNVKSEKARQNKCRGDAEKTIFWLC
jgi:hypothetical protein